MEEIWKAEKAALQGTQHIKKRIGTSTFGIRNARRAGDLARMSELQYGRIPELEKKLAEAKVEAKAENGTSTITSQ